MDTRTPLLGAAGRELTGVESRTLRAALNLERRHVVALANALGVGDRITTVALLTNWERSKGRGYPPDLVAALGALEIAVSDWANHLAQEAATTAADKHACAVARPLGARRIHQLLAPRLPYALAPAALDALDGDGGDFWQVLADAATVLAVRILRRDGWRVHVQLDRQPDEAVNPTSQSAPEIERHAQRLAAAERGLPRSWRED